MKYGADGCMAEQTGERQRLQVRKDRCISPGWQTPLTGFGVGEDGFSGIDSPVFLRE